MLDLTQNLIQDGHKDLALKVLHKYDAEMPDIYPFIDLARSKYYLVATAYVLNDFAFGKQLCEQHRYLSDRSVGL